MTSPTELIGSDGGTGPEDLLLVRRALRGDATAVDLVLGRLACIPRFVYRLDEALGYGLGAEQLEDAVQQVYMAVWPRLSDFAGSAALESWVYGFCRNCLRAEARKRAMTLRVRHLMLDELDRGPSPAALPPEMEMLRAEDIDAMCAELERLEPEEYEAVRLRHLEGWSFEQIARRHDLPASTVKDRCYRAMMKLKARLERRDVSA